MTAWTDTTHGAAGQCPPVGGDGRFVADAVAKGAEVRTGGERIGNEGFFFEPTVLTDVRTSARIMNEEPFGPVALIGRSRFDEAVKRG